VGVGNTLCRKQSIDATPKASVLKDEIGNPKARPQFCISLSPFGLLIIHPHVPSLLLTDPSLAAMYVPLLASQSDMIVKREESLSMIMFSRRKCSVELVAWSPVGIMMGYNGVDGVGVVEGKGTARRV